MSRPKLPTDVQDCKGYYISNPSRKPKGEGASASSVSDTLGPPPVYLTHEQLDIWNEQAQTLTKADRLDLERLCRLIDKERRGIELSSSEMRALTSIQSRLNRTRNKPAQNNIGQPETKLEAFLRKGDEMRAHTSYEHTEEECKANNHGILYRMRGTGV